MRQLVAFLLVTVLSSGARASYIGVLFDTTSYTHEACATPAVPLRGYIVAVLGGDVAAAGITGAEFRLEGLDPSWASTATPNPTANLVLGDPLGAGCQIAFPTCQLPDVVILYTLDIVAPTVIQDVMLTIRAHQNPSNPNFACPRLPLCDAPVFAISCVGGADAWVRPCPVGVRAASWSAVRALYR